MQCKSLLHQFLEQTINFQNIRFCSGHQSPEYAINSLRPGDAYMRQYTNRHSFR